jgi:hypothetical protein
MKNKLKIILEKLSKQELEDFVKQDFSNSDIDLQNYAIGILSTLNDIEKLNQAKTQIETQLSAIKFQLEYKTQTLGDIKKNGMHLNIDDCWMVDVISLLVRKLPYVEYWDKNNNSICFSTEEEANEYVDYAGKIKVGNKFKIIDKGKHNDGTYNESARKFYNIEPSKSKEYCFDDNKVWKIKKVGYYEDKLIIPYVEREFLDDDNQVKIEWEMPRYLYKNIIFVD